MTAVLTIDGLDGSGKSVLAARLADALAVARIGVVRLAIDDFRRPVDWTRTDRAEAELYYDERYDLPLLERCLRAFAAGVARVEVPVFDGATERFAGTRDLVLAGARVAVVEGVFALRVPAAAAGCVVYLDVDPAEARRRIVDRDLAKGRARAEIDRRIDARYFPAHARYRAACDPRARAAVLIDNTAPAAARAVRRDLAALPRDVAAALDPVLPPLAAAR